MSALVYCLYALAFGAGLRVLAVDQRRRLEGMTPALARYYAPAAFICALFMFLLSEPQEYLWQDFLHAYYQAGAAALGGPANVVRLFSRGVHGFVNLPIVAYLFAPFGLLPPRAASMLFTAVGGFAAVAAWRQTVRAARLPAHGAALLALCFALNGPLYNGLREGNTTHITLLAVALALIRLRQDRPFGAGVLLGAAALLKLPLLLFGAYFVLRGRWRAVAGGLLVTGGAALLSVLVFGLDVHRLWYDQFVAGSGQKPIAAFSVQSVAALVARAERGISSLWDYTGQPLSATGSLVVKGVTAVTVLFALGAAVWPRRPRRAGDTLSPQAQEIEFLMVLVLACISSPLSWSHYYAWMLLPIAFLLAPSSPLTPTPASRRLGFVAIALLSLPVVWPPESLASLGWPAQLYTLFISHFLIGGFLLLWLLGTARFRLGVGSQS